jgi:hypothetical protein
MDCAPIERSEFAASQQTAKRVVIAHRELMGFVFQNRRAAARKF